MPHIFNFSTLCLLSTCTISSLFLLCTCHIYPPSLLCLMNSMFFLYPCSVHVPYLHCFSSVPRQYLFHIYCSKKLGEHFKNASDLNEGKNNLEYLYRIWESDVWVTKGCHNIWWKWKLPPCRGVKPKTPKNESEKVMQQTGPFCQNVIVSTQNDPQEFVWPPRACIHASQHHKETTGGVLEDLLPDLDQDITELLDSLRRHLEAQDGLKHNVLEMFYWV